MTKFKEGDRVVSDCGATGVVLGSIESVSVKWDGWNIPGTWPAARFELIPRTFKPGQFVRIVADDETNGEVGFIFEDDGDDERSDPYWVALFDDDETEAPYSADELIPWRPLIGTRVVATDDEDEFGTVIGIDGDTARVLWDEYPTAQNWPVDDLEPADESESDFEIGDEVEYTNPFFTGSHKAIVTANDGGELIGVEFVDTPFRNGLYNKTLFERAA